VFFWLIAVDLNINLNRQNMKYTKRKNSEVAMLDSLLSQAALYHSTKEYKALIEFVSRMRNFAPFNAMLLQIQKPGVRFVASEADWLDRFKRTVNIGSRPLLIMWPFCPVALVYDVDDTDGKELPEDVEKAFRTDGEMTDERMMKFFELSLKKNIVVRAGDYGGGLAGNIKVADVIYIKDERDVIFYGLSINRNHDIPVQFTTLAHELAHLFLGHLGLDKRLKIPSRSHLNPQQQEVEAESVAYLVCNRNGLNPDSHKYLSQFEDDAALPQMEVYQIMRATGQIEQLLGLGYKTKFDTHSFV
jgi:hypothetical protein